MTEPADSPHGPPRPRAAPGRALGIALLAASVAGWMVLAWLALDMQSPVAQWMMPDGPRWRAVNVAAVGAMWAVMMAAMMLPSAWPMLRTFIDLCAARGEPSRSRGFAGAYLLVWAAFSLAATGAQWALQALGWIDPMIASTSARLDAVLLVIAGLYQFSPLKRICLARCRTPMGFLLAEWREGAGGGFVMGLRHGLFCVGCCGALMALLFVGGVMNLAWVAALAIAVAIEKLARGGARVATGLGIVLIAAGVWRFFAN